MSFKTISITLPGKMIQEIDAMLLEKNFASRSDFFRHLVRMWQLETEQKTAKQEMKDEVKDVISKSSENEFAGVDLEFGIPEDVIKKLEEKAKLLN
ncbi:MAG: ribbon-helix-helix domain-containing protein [Patescibacteria group bacterium]